ncbi:MAG: site-specific DNA-methyltransferase [Casimicrobiaceae bacterium]
MTPSTPRAISITYRPLADLRLNPQNPRAHSGRQVQQIANSIEAFGFNVPVLVDATLKVIAGHGRVMACRELGWTEVPTIGLEHLTSAQARAFMLADNRLTDNSSWDEGLLAQSLKDLAELDLDFRLDATGFEMAEIDLRIEQLDAVDTETDEAVELPGPNAVAISKAGDLWCLGPHRLLCGNALQSADYDLLLGGRKANVVFTDPPYNVPIDGHAAGNGRTRHREFAMAVGEMSSAEFTRFLHQVCVNLRMFSTDGSIHYLCMDWRHVGELLAAAQPVFSEWKNLCVWVKDNAGMGSLYRSQHELVLVFKNGTAPHVNNVQLGQFGRYRSNVWNYPGANSFSRTTDEGNLLALHPTVKPVAMIVDALFDCSKRGDRVLDPFLGSGTTLIAAERTGRHCYGIELDPLYVDTGIRRWQTLTGLQATHAETGRTFDRVAADAEGAGNAAAVSGSPDAEVGHVQVD